jgi:hypothetical protein
MDLDFFLFVKNMILYIYYQLDLQLLISVLDVGSPSLHRRLTVEKPISTVNRRYTEPIPTVNQAYVLAFLKLTLLEKTYK